MKREWARDVANEMQREDEAGNSPLNKFLDEMMNAAADMGSEALLWPNVKVSDAPDSAAPNRK